MPTIPAIVNADGVVDRLMPVHLPDGQTYYAMYTGTPGSDQNVSVVHLQSAYQFVEARQIADASWDAFIRMGAAQGLLPQHLENRRSFNRAIRHLPEQTRKALRAARAHYLRCERSCEKKPIDILSCRAFLKEKALVENLAQTRAGDRAVIYADLVKSDGSAGGDGLLDCIETQLQTAKEMQYPSYVFDQAGRADGLPSGPERLLRVINIVPGHSADGLAFISVDPQCGCPSGGMPPALAAADAAGLLDGAQWRHYR